jgi:hypothetical protein
MNVIDTRDAALRLGCSARWVRYLIAEGRLRAQRISGVWVIDEASVEQEAEQRKEAAACAVEKQGE